MKRKVVSLLLLLFGAFPMIVTLGACREGTASTDEPLPQLVIGGAMHKPYFYIDENGAYAGIDVEIARVACRRMGYEPIFREIPWVEKDEILASGAIDCIWTCFSMNGREEAYAWAGPYASDREVVAVLCDSDIYTLSDLADKRIAVQMTSKAEEIFASSATDTLGAPKAVFTLYDMNEGVSALRRQYVDACAGHEAALINMLEDLSVEYRILDEAILVSKMGVAFAWGEHSEARLLLDGVLKTMLADGTIRDIFASHGARSLEV